MCSIRRIVTVLGWIVLSPMISDWGGITRCASDDFSDQSTTERCKMRENKRPIGVGRNLSQAWRHLQSSDLVLLM